MEPHYKIVATGTWLYDGQVLQDVRVVATPAKYASSRYDENEELDEAAPIPVTADGLVYYVAVTGGREFDSLEAAKAWADSRPWGPVEWDLEPLIV